MVSTWRVKPPTVPNMKPSELDPRLMMAFMGTVSGRRGYIHRLQVKGPQANVVAFEQWCLEILKRDFRTTARIRSYDYQRTIDPNTGKKLLISCPIIDLTLDFRDAGKLALIKLQWT